MNRYGNDFERDRWGGMRGERERGGRGEWRGRSGAEGGGFGGRGGGRGYAADFDQASGRGGMRGGGRGDGPYDAGGWGSGSRGGYEDFGASHGYPGRDRGGSWGGRSQGEGRVRIADLMTEDPEVVTADATLADAARRMRDLNVGIIPVVESDDNRRLRGVITDRDIAVRAVAEGKDAAKTKVADCMTSDLETCNKNDSVADVMRVMQREQVRRVPITDRDGRLVGIVAQADLAVDYLDVQPGRKREVARTLRSVSEPGEPEGMAASGTSESPRRGRGGGRRASQEREAGE
jgi:CBS domain-containing protein